MENLPGYSKRATYRDVFPSVQTLEIAASQDSSGFLNESYLSLQTYNLITGPKTIPCANHNCKRGGFELQNLLHWMIEAKKTEDKFELLCDGDEGSRAGRRIGKDCMNDCEIVVKITYKD